MRQHPVIILISSLILMMSSCAQSAKERNAAIVAEWVGKQMVIPDSLVYTIAGDTINYDPLDADFTIIALVDSAECTECAMRLAKWQNVINELNSDPDIDVNFLMVVNTPDAKEAIRVQKRGFFTYPLAIDTESQFKKANPDIPTDLQLHAFLVNPRSEVVAIGSPVLNPNLLKVMKRAIGCDLSNDDNRVKAVTAMNSVGILHESDSIHTTFTLINSSDSTAIISGIVESCDCMHAEASSSSLSPGEKATITLTLNGDTATSRKSVDIFFTDVEQSLHLKTISFAKKQPAASQRLY